MDVITGRRSRRGDQVRADFTDATSMGAEAYARQLTRNHPELDAGTAAQDAVLAVQEFTSVLLSVG